MNNDLKRLNLELSAHCSYACFSCPNTYMSRPKGHMSLDLFQKIFDEIDGKVERVYLWNYGEPLLNPKVSEMIRYTQTKSPRTILSTTGTTFVTMKDIECLGLLNELIVSINGFDKETYAFHQKGGDLERVIKGIERIKPIMSISDTDYKLQIVVNTRNLEQLEMAEEFARKYGFKKIVMKSFNAMDENKDTEELYVPKIQEFTRKGIGVSEELKNIPCLEWMVINWNGDVNLCCWDYKGEIVVGNVLEDGVFGVWESDKMRELKTKLETEKVLPYCGQCVKKTTIKELNIL